MFKNTDLETTTLPFRHQLKTVSCFYLLLHEKQRTYIWLVSNFTLKMWTVCKELVIAFTGSKPNILYWRRSVEYIFLLAPFFVAFLHDI